MNEYIRLLEIVKNKMEIRQDSFGSVIAAKIHNNEEFDLMVSFWAAAYSSCFTRAMISGSFVGEDWYFIESQTIDYGMEGKSTTYFTQTLTEKKQKFLEFCREFDADGERKTTSMIYNAEVPKKIAEDQLKQILKVDGDKYIIELPVPNHCPAIYEVVMKEGESKDSLHVVIERKA